MTIPETEVLTAIIARVFRIEEVTAGDPKRGYLLRCRGELTRDSLEAYKLLEEALKGYQLTPMFRIEEGRQTILLAQLAGRGKPGRVWINIGLFLLTLLAVLFAGAMYSYNGSLPEDFMGQMRVLITNLWTGWPFAASLVGILLAHELGHYFAGRLGGAAVTLPYFIPLPLSPLGTMGAFIQMKSIPRNKRALFDLAVAGPLAGLAVAIPVLILGLSLSKVDTTRDTTYVRSAGDPVACPTSAAAGETYTCPQDNMLEGNSLLYLGLKYLVKGELLPAPVSYDGSPLLYWIRYLITGRPLPIGGLDVIMHPVAWAGWAGILVTFLNLLPAGQLDGGHILYAVFGRRSRKLFPFVLGATLLLGFFWSGWWMWSFLLFFLVGRSHAEPLDQITELDERRKGLAIFMLLVFALVLMPVPFVTF